MKVVTVSHELTNPLVKRYLYNFSEISSLYEHDPFDLKSFENRFEVVTRDYNTDRDRLAEVLKEYNLKLNCGSLTIDNIEKLKHPEATVIVTGQQAGVLTGPLYTVYKAITAILLAREISKKYSRYVIPMFWVAAEDHDYAEVDHVDLINREQEITRIKLDYAPNGKFSVGNIPVTEAVFELIDELVANTNPSEWKEDMISLLKKLAVESDNLADWFSRVMTWLFSDYGLVMINPMKRKLRKFWAHTFKSFLEQADRVNEKLSLGIEKVKEMGFTPQVDNEKDNVNMFLYIDGQRLALFKKGDRFCIRDGSVSWSLQELTELAQEKPECLSPNVVLRPIAQDDLLPILAYVGGPGEISYYALYSEIYPLFGQRMPIIYPRVNITLIEPGVARHMQTYGISFELGPEGISQLLIDYLASQDKIGIDHLFYHYTSELRNSFNLLLSEVSKLNPELSTQGNEVLNKIMHQLGHFEQKTRQYHRKSCDTAVKRFKAVETQLFPKRNLQERVFNIFPYLFKYPGLIKELIESPLLIDKEHKLLYLGVT